MEGVWARGASRKICDSLLIYATVVASNFKFGTQLGFGTGLPKTTFKPKISEGLGYRGAFKKISDPLVICATVEARNFKCGKQLGFGE